MSTAKKQYPISEGWLHVTANMNRGAKPLTKETMLFLAGAKGIPEDQLEIAEFFQGKTVCRIILRKKDKKIENFEEWKEAVKTLVAADFPPFSKMEIREELLSGGFKQGLTPQQFIEKTFYNA